MTARKKGPPKDAEVNALATELLDLAKRLSTTPCPACGGCCLSAEIVSHSGVRITCAGLDESEAADEDDGCTFVRIRRIGAPVPRRAGELIVVAVESEGKTE